ncbi:hypothetical protein FACS1894132_10070 [Clostridia bacterium]|nr:hypothetical protein FACS1894132_10070 [Clostridia bacterium]
MKAVRFGYNIIFMIFFIVLMTLKTSMNEEIIVKILVLLYLFLTFLYSLFVKSEIETQFLTVALFFIFIAEILVAFGYVFGYAFFALTHIFLIMYFVKITHKNIIKSYQKFKYLALLILLVIYSICTVFIENNLLENTLQNVLIVPIYMLLLTIMLWKAICVFIQENVFFTRIFYGALLFYLCDMLVLFELTTAQLLPLIFVSWVAYIPAIFFIEHGRQTQIAIYGNQNKSSIWLNLHSV